MSKDVTLKLQPFQQFEQPKEKAIIITNPPYGERISTNDLLGLYSMIGERLKHAFTGNTAWILSYREECFDQIGLKATTKIPLFNGALECEFRKYEIFDGKYKNSKARKRRRRRQRVQTACIKREKRVQARRKREFKSGEKRDFKPRERREFKSDDKREFKPREYRKPTDGEWKPKREFNREREFNKDRKPREFRKRDNERNND